MINLKTHDLNDVQKQIFIDHYSNNKNNDNLKSLTFNFSSNLISTAIDDLFQYSWLKNKKRWKNNKRLHKKFRKEIVKYVPKDIAWLYTFLLVAALRPRINYSEIAAKLMVVEPLPTGALAYTLDNS